MPVPRREREASESSKRSTVPRQKCSSATSHTPSPARPRPQSRTNRFKLSTRNRRHLKHPPPAILSSTFCLLLLYTVFDFEYKFANAATLSFFCHLPLITASA